MRVFFDAKSSSGGIDPREARFDGMPETLMKPLKPGSFADDEAFPWAASSATGEVEIESIDRAGPAGFH